MVVGILLAVALAGIASGIYLRDREKSSRMPKETSAPDMKNNSSGETLPMSPAPQQSKSGFDYPIAGFKDRVTKKPFGIFITPENSPVQPERFTGYHTGVDIEYQDVSDDVPVFAVEDGNITLSRIASGYGGVFILSADLNGTKHSFIYGHIRPSTLPRVNSRYKKGSQIGFLGTGYSAETDNERKHLHFGVLADNGLDLRGYVQTKDELSGWIDPMTLFP